MFRNIVDQLIKAGERSRTQTVSIIPLADQSRANEIKEHFKYTYKTLEFGEHVRELLSKSIRRAQIIIIRDVATNRCAVFRSIAETIKVLGIAKTQFVTKRLECPYDLDVEWQFASIIKGEPYDIKWLFRNPLKPLPDDFTIDHNKFHIVLEKNGVKELVIGYYRAQCIAGLTKHAFYNLLEKQGCSVPWCDYTAKVALVSDLIYFKNYTPSNLAHVFYATRDAHKAINATGVIAFGQRANSTNKAKIEPAFKEAIGKVKSLTPLRQKATRGPRRRLNAIEAA